MQIEQFNKALEEITNIIDQATPENESCQGIESIDVDGNVWYRSEVDSQCSCCLNEHYSEHFQLSLSQLIELGFDT